VAFIDNLQTTPEHKFTADLRKSLATGLRVSIHPRQSVPSMQRGITVNPGTETTISVKERRYTRLPGPWEGCYSPGESETKLTSDECIDVCAQDKVRCAQFSHKLRIEVFLENVTDLSIVSFAGVLVKASRTRGFDCRSLHCQLRLYRQVVHTHVHQAVYLVPAKGR